MWQKHGRASVTRRRRRRVEKAIGDGGGVTATGNFDDAAWDSGVVKTECVYAPFDSGKINETHGGGQ